MMSYETLVRTDAERIRSALQFLDPNDRLTWVEMAFAIKSEMGEDGFDIWDDWGSAHKRPQSEVKSTWKSAKPGSLNIGTLFYRAKAAGWKDDTKYEKPSPEVIAQREANAAARKAQFEAEEAAEHEVAATLAQSLWDEAQPCTEHDYLTRKGVQSHELKCGPFEIERTDPDTGEVTKQRMKALLVPLYDHNGKLWSLQAISRKPGGKKLLLAGGKMAGNFFAFGKPKEINGRRVFILGEGYATCASIYEDTGHMVFMCVNSGNILHVAKAIRERDADAIILIAGDNDIWNRKADGTPHNPGRLAAEKAAKEVGGIVALPPFTEADATGKDDKGNLTGPKDFNDLYVKLGPCSVQEVIDAALYGQPSPPEPVHEVNQTRVLLVPTRDEALGIDYAYECLQGLDAEVAKLQGADARLYPPLIGAYEGQVEHAVQQIREASPRAVIGILAAPGDEAEARRVADLYGASVDVPPSADGWRGWGEYFIDLLFDRIDAVAGEDHASLEATTRVLEQAQSAPVVHDELYKFSGVASMSLSDEAVEMAEQALEQAATDGGIASPRDASTPALEDSNGLIAEVGIIPLGSHGGDLVFWRRDFKRVVILAPKALGSHQGLQCLAPTQNWEAWWCKDFKPQFASNVLINWSAGLGDVDLSRVPATDAKPEEVREAFLRAKAAASGTSPAPVVLAELLALSPEWRGVVFFDEFASRATYSVSPPCGGSAGPLTDGHDDMLAAYLSSKYGLSISSKAAHDTVNLLGAQNPRHPLREYLKSLTWDGVPRLDTWLVDYAGAKDCVFVRAASAKTLIAAVERAFVPGSKVDTALVLEGAQGVKKSTLLRALAPDTSWFAEDLAGTIGGKDALQGLHGKWMIELSEIAAIKKGTVEDVKAFLTRRVDSYRSPYGRRVADHPRQCIFVGSVNPSADGSWLHDTTGGRRFWPVQVTKADVARLAQVRDQLWAEAVHRHQAGEQHWLDESEEEIATKEQKARLQENPWDFAVAKFLESRAFNGEPIATAEIFEFSQNRKPASKDSRELTSIAEALRARGWIKKPHGPARTNRWFSGSPI